MCGYIQDMLQQIDLFSRQVDDVKSNGVHYTPSQLALFVAKEMSQLVHTEKGESLRILDPAIGDGELIIALLQQLKQKMPTTHFEVVGFDVDDEAISCAKQRIQSQFDDVSTDLHTADFLEFATKFREGMLETLFPPIDVVISNPPYVRTQVIGSKKAQALAKDFDLSGRVDLSSPFLKGITWVSKPGGVVGVIVSNRFMTTKSGAKVREHLQNQFHIEHVWDLGDTKLFDAAVLPAVLLLKKRNADYNNSETRTSRFSTVYETNEQKVGSHTFLQLVDALPESGSGVVKTQDGKHYKIQHGHLACMNSSQDVWRIETAASRDWLNVVRAHTYCCFKDIGKVRVGVKTTADKVFIRDDWDSFNYQPELLKPILTHHIGRRFRAKKSERQKQILYTHEYRDGKRRAVDLNAHPFSANYLEKNRDILSARQYVIKAKRNWYEIWVPQDPNKWGLPKLVFRDIVEKPTFWMDLSGAVVNGDCYWMTSDNEGDETMLWLALAVANSTFIEQFYDYRFNNKLYAGRRRFITQYVEKFPLPDPMTQTAKELVQQCKRIYEQMQTHDTSIEERELDRKVWNAFGF